MRVVLLFSTMMVGCAEGTSLDDGSSAPATMDAAYGDDDDDESATSGTSSKADRPQRATDTAVTASTDDDGTDSDPVLEAMLACADGGVDADAFDRAYAARMCEEWEACDGTDCLPGMSSEAGFDASCDFDAEAACDCLDATWTCEPSYAGGTELWVVVPDLSCFVVYDGCGA